ASVPSPRVTFGHFALGAILSRARRADLQEHPTTQVLLRCTRTPRPAPSIGPDMGRKSHTPDPTTRRQVEAMAGYGGPAADIAGVIGIDAKTLRKHYRDELKNGHVKANAKVAEN